MRNDNIPNNYILSILEKIDELNRLKDVDTILDRILYESRKISKADAGSIFLVQDQYLKFSYVHNDTLFREEEANALLYANFKLPISELSIVGFVALTRKPLVIDDAYRIPDNVRYSFDTSWDQKSGYKTVSILTLPLITFENQLVGVMQLLNAKNERGAIVPFSEESQLYVPLFANSAAAAIQRAVMDRELILRMVRMAELKDPRETGAHVQRVGAYSAEIYHQWALKNNVEKNTMKSRKDLIRVASMLHDVGKVGVTDAILKKPGKLTEEEYEIMKWHTVFGARLFIHNTSELDTMSRDIALNHHEKWAGGGYPGYVTDLKSETVKMGAPKKGKQIPLEARVTSLADVFDALTSKRSYKDPWPDEKILKEIEKESGTHFDPELVEIFFQIFDVIKAIRKKFRD